MIKLIHIPRFRSTRALWLYYELQLLYQQSEIPKIDLVTFHDINSFRINKPKWLLDINPNGKVPTMVHNSIVMFESGAICSYLLDQFDVERLLLPRNAQYVSSFYLYISWCASTIDNLTATSSPLSIIQSGKCNDNNLRPMDNITENLKYFNEIVAPYISKELTNNGGPYLCGINFTAADIILGYNIIMMIEKMQPSWIACDHHPEIHKYYLLIRNRPALLQALSPV